MGRRNDGVRGLAREDRVIAGTDAGLARFLHRGGTMQRIRWLFLGAALFLPALAGAQERVAAIPTELQEAWIRFGNAWRQAEYAQVAPLLTPDFALSTAAGHTGRQDIAADEWPTIRSRIGLLDAPGFFVPDGERILEIGRTHVPRDSQLGLAEEEEYMCAPPPEFGRLQPLTYWREWVRTPDRSWKVKAIVLP
jgi:hypothetical protein